MMRVYFCPSCGRWRMVSNHLEAECLDCDTPLLLSDIPFGQWVKLDYPMRDQVAAVFLEQKEHSPEEKEQHTLANIRARKAMEGLLGEPVPSNQPEHEDTGYDY